MLRQTAALPDQVVRGLSGTPVGATLLPEPTVHSSAAPVIPAPAPEQPAAATAAAPGPDVHGEASTARRTAPWPTPSYRVTEPGHAASAHGAHSPDSRASRGAPQPVPADGGAAPCGTAGGTHTPGQAALLPAGEPHQGSAAPRPARGYGYGTFPQDRPEDVQVFPA